MMRIFIEMVKQVVGSGSMQDIMLLRRIQQGVVSLVSEHNDSPLFASCARSVYGRPDVLLSAMLNQDVNLLASLVSDVFTGTGRAAEEVSEKASRAAAAVCPEAKAAGVEAEAQEGVEAEAGADAGRDLVQGVTTEAIEPLSPQRNARDVEKLRRRMKRVLADNLRDSFF